MQVIPNSEKAWSQPSVFFGDGNSNGGGCDEALVVEGSGGRYWRGWW